MSAKLCFTTWFQDYGEISHAESRFGTVKNTFKLPEFLVQCIDSELLYNILVTLDLPFQTLAEARKYADHEKARRHIHLLLGDSAGSRRRSGNQADIVVRSADLEIDVVPVQGQGQGHASASLPESCPIRQVVDDLNSRYYFATTSSFPKLYIPDTGPAMRHGTSKLSHGAVCLSIPPFGV